MVSTRKNVGRMVDKKNDEKRKRSMEDDSSRNVKKRVKAGVVKSPKERKKGVVKSPLKDKKLGRQVSKKRKEMLDLDSDFEDRPNKVGNKVEDDVYSRNIISRQKHLKIWDLYYEERHRNFSGKIIYWSDMEVPSVIMKKLTEDQLEELKLTCFGNFVDVGEPQMFSQIIHQALVREVYQRDKGEMWFLFGDKRVRFGLPEFCLISGLSWKGNEDISAFKGMENQLVEKFFGDEVVTRTRIGRIYRNAVFDDNEEAVRMSVIFLVLNFLLATVSDNHVDEALINFLSYGDLDSYPWGKFAFEQTKNSLSLALKGHLKKGMNGGVIYNLYKDNYCKSYKLKGLPYVFQVFLFETIPTLKVRGFCIDENLSEVRLFRWKELGKPPKNDKLNDLVFGSGQLWIQMLIPTDDEKDRLNLGGFHFFHGHDGGSNVVDMKVDKTSKGRELGISLSDVRNIVDERVRPLEKKVIEVKKEIKKLGFDLKLELHAFHIDICRDIRKILRDQLRGRSNVNKGGNEGDDDDDDDGSESRSNGNELDGDDISDESNDVRNGSDDANKFDGKTDDDVGGMRGVHSDGDDDKIGKNNDKPTFDILSQTCGKEIVVFTPTVVHIDVVDDKIGNNNDIPTFDILSQSSGKELVPFNLTEGGKIEAENISVLDEMILTTQDILHCAEVERNAFKPCGRPVRVSAKSAVLRSPYTTKFGSAQSSSSAVLPTQIRRGLSAFSNVCMGMPSKFEDVLFDQWFKIGINNRKRTEKFSGDNDIIEPAFRFGSVPISSKMWFYKLKTPGEWLDDDHINICFYYFRKLARHSSNIQIRVTTTDCWFHLKLSALYGQYCLKNADTTLLSGEDHVAEYIRGYLMDVNTPWVAVDYVLFPIHMSQPEHWFLLIFDVHRRRLVVFNSLQPSRTVMRTNIIDVCEAYIFILPIILSKCGFWKGRSDIDFSSEPYVQKGEHDIIELEFAEGVPEQIDGDCGMFTVCFAEHFLHQKFAEMPNPFPIIQYRKKLCVNLFMHARNKQIGGYDSDTEYPGRFVPEE